MTSAPAQRRAVLVHQTRGAVSVRSQTLPEQEVSGALLKVRPSFVGVCGSDLEQVYGELDPSFRVTYPHVMGHEWSGVVVDAGPEAVRFRAGDRVIGHGSLGGNEWFGVTTDGAMADTFLVPEVMCFEVPGEVSMLRAALVEPLACCLHALRVAGGTDGGQRVVVFGCGAIGLSMVALARSVGATVVAVDRSPQRLNLAATLGADHGVEFTDQDTAAASVVSALDGAGADLSVEATGAPSAQSAAIEVTASDARVLFMGLGHRRADRVSLHAIANRHLRLMASVGAPPDIWQPALRLLQRTGIDLSPMVSDVFGLSDGEGALEAARDAAHHAKVVLSPDA